MQRSVTQKYGDNHNEIPTQQDIIVNPTKWYDALHDDIYAVE